MLIYTDSIFMRNELLTYRISSNNSRGRLFLFSPHMRKKMGVIIRGKAIIRLRLLFQILLTGRRALNILFYFPIKK